MVEPQLYPRIPKNKRASRRHHNEDIDRRWSVECHHGFVPRDAVNSQGRPRSIASPVRTSRATTNRASRTTSMNTHTTADVSTQTEFHDYEHEDEDDIFHDALEVRVPPIRREEESATEPQHPLEAANIDVIILNAVLDSCLEEIAALREELTDVYKQRAEAHAEFARIEAVLFEVLGIDHAAECVVCVWD